MTQQAGQKLSQFYVDNRGGLNLTDSFLRVQDNQALGGYNYEYVKTGGIQKSLCPNLCNATADAQLRTHGLALRNTQSNGKSVIRAAGTKIQKAFLDGSPFINLVDDTQAAASDFISSSNVLPVNNQMFVGINADVLWLAGGGMSNLVGVFSDTQVTANGVVVPTGTFTTNIYGSPLGQWGTVSSYYYAIAFQKASTGAV
jgi:hypothetical protein